MHACRCAEALPHFNQFLCNRLKKALKMKHAKAVAAACGVFVLMAAATPALCDTIYDFTISGNWQTTVGTPVTGTGTFSVSNTPSTVFGFTGYAIDSVTFDGSPATLDPGYEGADNYLFLNGYGFGTPQGLTDGEGIAFETAGGQAINITYAGGGVYNEYALLGNTFSEGVRGDFSVSLAPTPLPAALPLFAGGLGMIGLVSRRKKRKAQTGLAAA
jgi:hypothetical protein